MTIRKYDPSQGCACQGDIVIVPLPKDIHITSNDEIPMRDGMLILAEGELTGHHHAIRFGLGPSIPHFRDDALARDLKLAAPVKIGTAHLYRDPKALAALVMTGFLETPSLCRGFLRVEKGAPPITHEEHDAIELPPGEYYVGGKREVTVGDGRSVQWVRD